MTPYLGQKRHQAAEGFILSECKLFWKLQTLRSGACNEQSSEAQHPRLGTTSGSKSSASWRTDTALAARSTSVVPNHPRDDGMVKTAEDFDRKALHGGCQRDCDTLLPRCGHRCHLKCHPFDPEHKDPLRASKQPCNVQLPSLTARMSCANNFCSRPWP